jgi:N-acetylmuramoyl-L-alanine amidase
MPTRAAPIQTVAEQFLGFLQLPYFSIASNKMRLTPDLGHPRISPMILARSGMWRSCDLAFLLLCGLVFALNPAPYIESSDWNREAAKSAWAEAEKLLAMINSTPEPSRESYLKCLRTYQQVYMQDPHYGYSPDAVFEAAKLYQTMGERFADLSSYRNAARLYLFLATDYGQSPRCPEALLRLGALSQGPLNDEQAAQDAYQRLRTQYKSSAAAATLAARGAAGGEPAPLSLPATPVAPQPRPRIDAEVANAASTTAIKSISIAPFGNHTRVSIVSDGKIQFSKGSLTNPARIFFDLKDVQFDHSLINKTINVEDRFLKQVRIAQFTPDLARLVLDLGDAQEITSSETSESFGVVVDLHGRDFAPAVPGSTTKPAWSPTPSKEKPASPAPDSSAAAVKTTETAPSKSKAESGAPPTAPIGNTAPKATASPDKAIPMEKIAKDDRAGNLPAATPASAKEKEKSPPPGVPVDRSSTKPAKAPAEPAPKPALPTARGDRTLTRVLGLKIGRIVLDPGHGGRDTGTIGPAGVMEKDLVLDIAKELQRLLEDRLGAQVIMTRSDDSFVALEDRPLMANQQQADLFVSIHANSSTSRSVSGVETYFLDFARTDSAREVATRENASSDRNYRDLESLILKIAQADKLQESRELALTIQKNLYEAMHKLMPGTMNRGVRSAPFIVLIGAHMPSILAEVSFLSNPQDEKLLQKDACRQSVALALFQGIETYMKSLGSAVAINRFHKN